MEYLVLEVNLESRLDNNIRFFISSKLDLGDFKYCYILNSFSFYSYLRFRDLETFFLSA